MSVIITRMDIYHNIVTVILFKSKVHFKSEKSEMFGVEVALLRYIFLNIFLFQLPFSSFARLDMVPNLIDFLYSIVLLNLASYW